ncbi:MAG: AsmA family protein [Reyranella sp.]|nr:AsmA family protein [Reyranella sp.]
MAMRRRTKIGIWAAAVVGVLMLAWSAVPYLVDMQVFKPAMIQAVKEATGRELLIDGPIELSMYPVPGISARQVHFANATGTTGAQMLDVLRIVVRPSVLALLQGRIEVGTLFLYRPTIVLEADADGKPNWEFAPGANASQPQGAPSNGLHLAVGRLAIVRGTIKYTDPRSGKTHTAEDVRVRASVGSLDGPMTLEGTATVNGVPLLFDLSVGGPSDKGHRTILALEVASGKLAFDGWLGRIAPDGSVMGQLSVATGRLTDFIGALVSATGGGIPKFEASVVGSFAFDGGIEVSPRRVALTNFKTSMGGETASGTVSLDQDPTPTLTGKLTLPQVDVEKWITVLQQPGIFAPPPATPPTTPAPATKPAPAVATKPGADPAAKPAPAAPAAKPAAPAAKPPVVKPVAAAASPFPAALNVKLSVDAAQVLYRKGTIRDLSIVVEIHKGAVTVPQFKAILPGEMIVQANATAPVPPAATTPPAKPAAPPAKPAAPQAKPAAPQAKSAAPQAKSADNAVQASGEISIVGPKLRDTLAWLEIDASGVPAGKLRTLGVKGKLTSTANGVQLNDVAFDLDDQHATGSGAVTFGLPLAVATQLQVDRFDLDAYTPTTKSAAQPSLPALPTGAVTPAAAVTPAKPTAAASVVPPPSFGLKAKVASLVYRGQPLKGVDADLTVQGNVLKLNGIKVADLLGAKLDLRGSVTDFGTAPRFDLTFNTTMPDTEKLLDYAGLPKFMNGKIGAASAGGGVAGTMGALTLRDANVTMLGATARATGVLALGDAFSFNFSSFALQAQDASQLVSVASGTSQTGIGALSASGTFKGNADRAGFEGNLAAVGNQMTGKIDATLGKRPNITVNLKVPGTLDFDKWLGVSPVPQSAPAAAPGAGAPQAAPPPSAPTSPAASGKPIDLSALRSFDASLELYTSALTVGAVQVNYGDLTATLKNGVFKISRLTGQFYSGAVDFTGTVDASKATLGIDLAGSLQGIYLGEMLRGTAGTNTFGNDNLTVAVDGKINVMNIALKGGGNSPEAIRNSLVGSGQVSGYVYPSVTKGSLSFVSFAAGVASVFSSEMGFNSAVLDAFINRQSAISGGFQLANGTLTLQEQKVQGQNAVALVSSQTSLTAATTDTTIGLDVGKTGSVDFVMTVKGPMSAPTLNAGRPQRR